ncbi:hypothetical protein SLEP1_g33812 [Rubroshorea leprosula]|uniref:Transcription factor HY5 n=1 Tax=Rubroshorea leprosula TaxID=152421 RepID=A0AAV5KHS7_9ROSI|nr:hypothetical protein SLEP1_g33812 [Rubroshorea leprosula]
MESDEEIRRMPKLGGEAAEASAASRDGSSVSGPDRVQPSEVGQRKRGRSPANKENKRLKSCAVLRGVKVVEEVSAQQARERKKAYLNELETRVKDLEKKNSELEERLSTYQNENEMLRQVICLWEGQPIDASQKKSMAGARRNEPSAWVRDEPNVKAPEDKTEGGRRWANK